MSADVRATVESKPAQFILINVHSDKSNSDFSVIVSKDPLDQDIQLREYKNTYAIVSFRGNIKNTKTRKYFEFNIEDENYTILSVSSYLKPEKTYPVLNQAFVDPRDAIALGLKNSMPTIKLKPAKLEPTYFTKK